MNTFFKQLRSAYTLFMGLLLLPSVSRSQDADRPNVILINTDDVGTGWFPFYANRLRVSDIEPEILASYTRKRGHRGEVDPVEHIRAAQSAMPFLNSLAEEGIVFDFAFATASLCAPSRAGLLTGTFQQEWGAYWNRDVDLHGIPADRVVIAEPLQAKGYATAMIGKWHVAKKDPSFLEKVWTENLEESLPIPEGFNGRWPEMRKFLDGSGYQSSSHPGQHPLDRGFDYYFGFNSHDSWYFEARELWENHERVPTRPPGELLTDLFSDKANAFIESAIEDEKPFFVYYAPLTLHGPIVPPPAKYSDAFDTGHPYTDEYAGHLLGLDEGIRRIFTTLEAHGQLDNTLFIFTSDNGCTLYEVPPYNAPNRGGKGTGWFGGLNVPLMMWGANVKLRGVTEEIISLADLMPTIYEYVGADIPDGISGKSFFPFLSGESEQGPRDSLSSVSIHSSRWSWFYEGDGENNTQDGMLAPLYAWHFDGEQVLMRITPTRPGLYQSLPEGLPERVLFFDINTDRQQRHNLAESYWDRVQEMDEKLREWLSGLGEPLTSQQEDLRILLREVEKTAAE